MPTVTQHAPGTFCWPELATSDQEGAKRFYTSLFGWTFTDHEMGPSGLYAMFEKDGKEVGAVYTINAEQKKAGVPPNWGSYVAVENVDDAAKRAAKLGGKI